MSDMELIINSEIGENCTIDGESKRCIFDLDGGNYGEAVPTLRIADTMAINIGSVVTVRGKTYAAISIWDDTFGERQVILGDDLL